MSETHHTSGPVEDPAVETAKHAVPDQPHHDEEDVAAALERETDDGKGGAVVPAEDFVSYTDPNADKQEDTD
jgi:hypothetical protein